MSTSCDDVMMLRSSLTSSNVAAIGRDEAAIGRDEVSIDLRVYAVLWHDESDGVLRAEDAIELQQ